MDYDGSVPDGRLAQTYTLPSLYRWRYLTSVSQSPSFSSREASSRANRKKEQTLHQGRVSSHGPLGRSIMGLLRHGLLIYSYLFLLPCLYPLIHYLSSSYPSFWCETWRNVVDEYYRGFENFIQFSLLNLILSIRWIPGNWDVFEIPKLFHCFTTVLKSRSSNLVFLIIHRNGTLWNVKFCHFSEFSSICFPHPKLKSSPLSSQVWLIFDGANIILANVKIFLLPCISDPHVMPQMLPASVTWHRFHRLEHSSQARCSHGTKVTSTSEYSHIVQVSKPLLLCPK